MACVHFSVNINQYINNQLHFIELERLVIEKEDRRNTHISSRMDFMGGLGAGGTGIEHQVGRGMGCMGKTTRIKRHLRGEKTKK